MENEAPPQDFVLDGSMLGYGWRPTQAVLAKRQPKAAFTPGLKSHEKRWNSTALPNDSKVLRAFF
jgi:hypothetical protein